MNIALAGDVYITAVTVDDLFADSTYQRTLDVVRARSYAATWDRRLAGILEVSDRGEDADPRFAVIDGQHRWAAAGYLQTPPNLVANVHSGLSVADEAALFDKLNRQRKQTTTWDHWKARRRAGNELVLAVEQIAAQAGLTVTEANTAAEGISCIGTLEKIATSAGGIELLASTLKLLVGIWGVQDRGAYEAPIVGGLALVLHSVSDVDAERLIDCLCGVPPRRIRMAAQGLRDTTRGSLVKLTAITIKDRYNATRGPKITWPPRWSGSLPKAPRPAKTADEIALDIDEQAVQWVCQGTPMKLNTAEAREVIRRLDGKFDVTEIARRLHMSPTNVQQIRCRIGIAKPKAVAS